MKNKDWGRGRGGGLNREGGLLTFLLWKGGLIREEGLFEGGGGLNRGFTVLIFNQSRSWCVQLICTFLHKSVTLYLDLVSHRIKLFLRTVCLPFISVW